MLVFVVEFGLFSLVSSSKRDRLLKFEDGLLELSSFITDLLSFPDAKSVSGLVTKSSIARLLTSTIPY